MWSVVIYSRDSETYLGIFTDRGNMIESSVIAMDEKYWMIVIVKGSYIDICTVSCNCEKCNHERLKVSW